MGEMNHSSFEARERQKGQRKRIPFGIGGNDASQVSGSPGEGRGIGEEGHLPDLSSPILLSSCCFFNFSILCSFVFFGF